MENQKPEFIENSKKQEPCKRCEGKGKEPGTSAVCRVCGGSGVFKDSSYIMVVETAEGKIGFDVDNPGK
jgi:DnaJ-class molecular chaperone